MNEWVDECVYQWVYEHVHEWVYECVHEWVNVRPIVVTLSGLLYYKNSELSK